MVELEPINLDNWKVCANLKVHKEQEHLLPSNLTSIAELNFYKQTNGVAILNNQKVIVGFATYGVPENDSVSKIFRLMIDHRYQGKGYGKSALIHIMIDLYSKNKHYDIQVCYNPKEIVLKNFYGSVGFREEGILPCETWPEGKMIATLGSTEFEQLISEIKN